MPPRDNESSTAKVVILRATRPIASRCSGWMPEGIWVLEERCCLLLLRDGACPRDDACDVMLLLFFVGSGLKVHHMIDPAPIARKLA